MKPTVIQSGSGGGNPANSPGASGAPHPNAANQAPPNAYENVRQFPNFQTAFGFPGTEDDMFSDVRPRFGRLRDPFGFGARKRCGNETAEDPYERYFRDDSDFFPNMSHTWDPIRSRRRVASQRGANHDDAGFFDVIPPEFRQYLPEGFGFGRQTPKTTDPYHGPPQQTPHPQQYYEAHPQQHSAPAEGQRPQYCDASIQTEEHNAAQQAHNEGGTQSNEYGKNLKQHGLRNTIDLGQKSEPERCRSPRAQSAPPYEEYNQGFINRGGGNPNEAYANASAYASNYPAPGNAGGHASATSTPTANYANPSQAFNIPRTQAPQANQPQNTPPRPQPPQPQQNPQSPGAETEEGYVRHIPIFIEGRSEPIVNRSRIPPPQQQPPQQPQQQPQQQQQQYAYAQSPPRRQEFEQQRQVPPQYQPWQAQQPQQQQQQRPAPAQQQQPQQQQQYFHPEQRSAPPQRPTPLNTQQAAPDQQQQQVPQTPHTTESINKIQAIQKDVLELMYKVENFKGVKSDKEYIYLDEMLTRNLLKLDTIDTNGKESIRLARKEAIKCIEASINVLEAKAEQNARTAREAVMVANKTESGEGEETKADQTQASPAELKQEEGSKEQPKQTQAEPEVCLIAVPVLSDDKTPQTTEAPPTDAPSDIPEKPKEVVEDIKPESEVAKEPATSTEESSTKPEAAEAVQTTEDGPPPIEIVPKGSPNVKITIKAKKGKKAKPEGSTSPKKAAKTTEDSTTPETATTEKEESKTSPGEGAATEQPPPSDATTEAKPANE